MLAIALKSILGLPPGSRRTLFAVDGIATEQERDFAMKSLGRAVLKAYERIIDARHQADGPMTTSNALDDEKCIEAEADRLCRT